VDSATDTFVWMLEDAGLGGAPAIDKLYGFAARGAASGGDVLDMRGLLQGASANAADLLRYIEIRYAGGHTEFFVSSAGAFAGGSYNPPAEDQHITLVGLNLFGAAGVAAGSEAALLGVMLGSGNLLVDSVLA
jgi:hypothetical protein